MHDTRGIISNRLEVDGNQEPPVEYLLLSFDVLQSLPRKKYRNKKYAQGLNYDCLKN